MNTEKLKEIFKDEAFVRELLEQISRGSILATFGIGAAIVANVGSIVTSIVGRW